jgi:cysteine desulfurase
VSGEGPPGAPSWPRYNRSTMEPRIYLDHAATTPLRDEVREAMAPYLAERYGNPSSLHAEGRAAREALEGARESLRRVLKGSSFRLVFTGGGTEADNAALLGTLLGSTVSLEGSAAGHAVTSGVEHPAVLNGFTLAERLGFSLSVVEVDGDGRVDPAAVERALCPGTRLVSVMAANNEVGTLQPILEIGSLCRARSIPFHTDAVQLLGKGVLDLSELPVDLVTLSAHKVQGPKGVGALLVREGLPFAPILRGGGQESGLRAGTEPVAQAVGFARAVELAEAERPAEAPRLASLRERLRRGIEMTIAGARINTPRKGVLPGILNVSFDGVNGESLLKLLDHLQVAVSTGSACNTGAKKPSHVLQAMGRSAREVRGSIRFSLGRDTGELSIDAALRRLGRAVGELRRISPAGS